MDWIKIAEFSTRLSAETIGHALDQHDIPHIVQQDDAGGMFGGLGSGASLWIPADRKEDVARLLSCVVQPPPPETE